MLLLLADEAARGRRGSLHSIRDALDSLGRKAMECPDVSAVADRVTGADDQLLVVGGNAIVQDACAALSAMAPADRPSIGIVGSEDNDLVRTFGLDRGPFVAIQHALSDTLMPIDLMTVRIDGGERVAANAVEIGFGAELLRTRGDRSVRLRHRIHAARSLNDQATVTVTVDHTSYAEPLSRVIIANGQFLGDEGRVSPRALPDDGRLNVQGWHLFGNQLIAGPDGLHVGEHLGSEHVREHQTAAVTVTSEQPLAVAADGVAIGSTPVTVIVDHHAVQLHV